MVVGQPAKAIPKTPNVLYPAFLSGTKYTFDVFWHDIFRGCAAGKFPKGLRFDPYKNTVSIVKPLKRTSKKEGESSSTVFTIPSSDVEVFTLMMRLFKVIGLFSKQDIQVKIIDIDRANDYIVNRNATTNWDSIKLKHIKDYYVMDYISRTKVTLKLNDRETNNLSSVIKLGFQFKNIDAHHIEFTNGKIKTITNLHFDPTKRNFSLISTPTKSNESSTVKNKKPTGDKFIAAVDKYIKGHTIIHDKLSEVMNS